VSKPNPDKQALIDHLTHITRRWSELDRQCLLEVVFLSADDKAVVKDVQHYNPDALSLDIAAEHILAMNGHRLNAYATVNPVDAENRPQAGRRANASQIVGSFFHFADADDKQAADNIKNFAGPKCNFHVLTGKTPTPRPHVYWELEEPTRNLDAWSATQRAIAATLKTDPATVDPPRIMRIAGTINWPKPKKEAIGRVPELVELRFYSEDDRPRVTSEQMARAFTGGKSSSSEGAANDFNVEFDFAEDRKTAEEYVDMLRRARTDGEKHAGVRDLCASLAGAGVPQNLARAIVSAQTTIWDDNTENLFRSAYEKYYRKAHQDAPNFDHPAGDDSSGWQVQSAGAFTADFVAPEYVIDGVIQRGRLYTLTAPTGSGKTAAMLYASTAIATGGQFCGLETEPGDVLFLAGENPDDVRARVIATLEFYGIDPGKCRLHFIAGTFSIRKDMERLKAEAEKLPNLILIVVDTFAAYFDGDDENSNAQALDFARVVRSLTGLPSKPAAVMPAHPVKNATRGNLTPKGGSSLLNEVDGNLTLWSSDGLLSLHWQGKHRGPDFEPLKMELERFTSARLKDRKGREMPTILAKPVLELRATQIARETLRIEDQLLLNIQDSEELSMRERCVALDILRDDGQPNTGRISRLIERLSKDKMIKKVRRRWVLTKAGEDECEAIASGLTQPLETDE